MSELQASLNQVLQSFDQLGARELAMLQERLDARRQHPAQLPDPKEEFFDLSFADYLSLSDEEQDEIVFRAYQILQPWIDNALEERDAEWMLVSGGEVLDSSPTLQNYPSRERLMQIGQERDRVPFVFIRTPLIEESGWSPLARDDFYPTIQLNVGAPSLAKNNLQAASLEIMADFDTGSPSFFVDYEQMLARQIVDSQPIDQAHWRPHLGQAYRMHVLPILVGISGENGITTKREISALCVRDWRQSPLCRINPNREALAGRNLL
jgi:hypothetical protein